MRPRRAAGEEEEKEQEQEEEVVATGVCAFWNSFWFTSKGCLLRGPPTRTSVTPLHPKKKKKIYRLKLALFSRPWAESPLG